MKNILVAVDFSKDTAKVVDQAFVLAKESGAKLWIVHVTSDALQSAYDVAQFNDFTAEYVNMPVADIEMARELCAEEYKREHRQLLDLSAKVRNQGGDAQAMLLKGNTADLILQKAAELRADLIVMGSHGHGMLQKMLVGSVTESVLRKASCGVLIVPVAQTAPVL